MKQIELTNKKIWIGNNSELLKKVVDKLVGEYKYSEISNIGCHLKDNPSCIFIRENKELGACSQNYKKEEFNNSSFIEMLPSEVFEELTYEIY